MLHALLISATLFAATGESAPVDITSRVESALHSYVGKRVVFCGRYSARGKVAGFVATPGAAVYLVDYPYTDLSEGQQICVTGTLHFQPERHSKDPGVAGVLAYFYFARSDSSIRVLSSQPHTSNQSMKPTAPLRCNFGVFATTPCRGLSLSR
jgi:hypothetical protein